MVKSKSNILKLLGLIFTLMLFTVVFSSVNARAISVSKGTGTQFGYDKSLLPPAGSNDSTGAVIYFPTTIEGADAYCLGYCMAFPTSVQKSSTPLTTLEKAVLYEGKTKGYQGPVIQMALWMASSQNGKNGLRLNSSSCNVVSADNYAAKPNCKAMKAGTLTNVYNRAKQLYSAAQGYDEKFFKSSSQATITINKGENYKQTIKGDYVYKGPLFVTTESGNNINIKVNTDPSQVMIVAGVGATVSLSTVPSNGVVFLKVPTSYSGRQANVTFSTTSHVINGYRYTSGKSRDQDLATITEETTPAQKPWNYSWVIKGSIRIVKISDRDSKPISGVQFTLYDSSKKAIATKKTDANGVIEFNELTYGTYYIKEISAPKGYVMSNSDFIKIVVNSENSDVEKTIKNHYITARVSIKKYVELAGEKITPAAGDVTFTIYAENGVQVDQLKVQGNGVATSNYLPLGKYYLKETAVNGSYIKNNPTKKVNFEITEASDNQIITLEDFINEGIPGTLEIYKYATIDGKKTPIKGVKFQVYRLNNAAGGLSESNLTEYEVIETNAAGMAYLYDMKDGKYAYKEISVPKGYVLDGTVKSFEISKTNKKVRAEIENKVKKGSIYVNKTIDGTGKRLQGVEFTLYASNKTTVIKKVVTDSNGVAYFGDIKFGTYYIRETNAPDNVVMDTNYYKAVIGDEEGEKDSITLNIKNKLIDLGIKLYKIDDEKNPIKGVKFELYSDAEGKNKVATATTDASGLALFDKLKEGTYYYKEVSAPDGYITVKIADMKPIAIGYGANQNKVYTETIVNKPIKGRVRIVKVGEDNVVIKGAEFDIKDSNGKVVGHLVTDEKGVAVSDYLRKGNYTIVETKVPAGYILSTDAVGFAITTNNEIVGKRIVNKYNKGYIEIKKVDAETKEFISGAVFEIYKIGSDGKATKVDTISRYDSKGVGKSQELKNGKYYFVETVAPKNAILDSTKHEFEITDDKKQFSFTIENKIKKGQVKLIKNDDLGSPIKGVKFELLDANKKVIEELVTGDDGVAISQRHEVGTYYIKETYTPELYVPIVDLIKVDIKDDGQIVTLQKEIINKRIIGGIKIIKKDDGSTPISGVEFSVYKEGSSIAIRKLTTNEQGIAMTTDLELGKYYFVETKVPDHLYINTEKVSFEITKQGELITKEVINERVKGKLIINKTNSENGTGIEGVVFEIYDANQTKIGSIVTDLEGIATTESLKDKDGNQIVLYTGKYYYAEVAAPDRFYFDTDMHEFNIVKGAENVTLNIENIPFKIPQTGGVIGTDALIVVIVSIVSIAGYVVGNILINKRHFD